MTDSKARERLAHILCLSDDPTGCTQGCIHKERGCCPCPYFRQADAAIAAYPQIAEAVAIRAGSGK